MRDRSPNKILVEEVVFIKIRYDRPFTWKDIKHLDLRDDDELHIEYNEVWHEENNGMDAHFVCNITRMVEESDEQFATRQHEIERDEKWGRERRFESYLKLKKEFENDN